MTCELDKSLLTLVKYCYMDVLVTQAAKLDGLFDQTPLPLAESYISICLVLDFLFDVNRPFWHRHNFPLMNII